MAVSESDSDRMFHALMDLAKGEGGGGDLRRRVDDLVPRLVGAVGVDDRQEAAQMLEFKLSRHMTDLKADENQGIDTRDHSREFAVIERAIEALRSSFPMVQ